MRTSPLKDDTLSSSLYAPFINWQQEPGEQPLPIASPQKRVVVTATAVATKGYISHSADPGYFPPDILQAEASCALSLLSGKWTCELLLVLGGGAVRLSELRRRMPKASKKVLVEELRKLEHYGLLLRTDLSQRHRKHVEYRLAEGVYPEVQHLLKTLASWGLTLKGRRVGISPDNEAVTGDSRKN